MQEDRRLAADAHHARGFALRKQGDFRGAIMEYSHAIDLVSTHFKALFNRAFSHDKVFLSEHPHDHACALAIFENVLERQGLRKSVQ
jgi:hypothetical protein